MEKKLFALVCSLSVVATQLAGQEPPLTPRLLNEIRSNRYVDESVQTTNGNVVGIFTRLVTDKNGNPTLGVLQAYDNVTRNKSFIAVPWPLFRFDTQNRRIQIQAAAEQLRKAPKFQKPDAAALTDGSRVEIIYQHFGVTMGGGAVAATMGSQSGRDSSALTPPRTNEAQPARGSVGTLYVLGALALTVLGLGYAVRQRT
jgi:hypothetical protein